MSTYAVEQDATSFKKTAMMRRYESQRHSQNLQDSNDLCFGSGSQFSTAGAAKAYFQEQCVQTYEYSHTLCDSLADKVFDKQDDLGAQWNPIPAECAEVDALLEADRNRRQALGLLPESSLDETVTRKISHGNRASGGAYG